MPDARHHEPSRTRADGVQHPDTPSRIDAATLRAAARAAHQGAWWRHARREGWSRAPGMASAFGILSALACLVMGGRVSLPGSLGPFRGGKTTRFAAVRDRVPAGTESPSGMENDAMRSNFFGAMTVAGVSLLGSDALAQTAVEWKVSAGGNGHWYQKVAQAGSWTAAKALAEARGGHLATITSQAEQMIVSSIGAAQYWLGGYAPSNQGCGAAAWMWVTGEPMSYLGWASSEPGSPCSDTCMAFAVWGGYTGRWNNDACGQTAVPGFMIEWDADCNGDGIVDFGQILAGDLDDLNTNNIPDCCEQGGICRSNLAINGGFEAGTPLSACSTETVPAGTALGTGWMVASGSVQRVSANSACSGQGLPRAGEFLIDLLDAGEIVQTVATTPGRSYRLTFWLSGDCAGGGANKRVIASLGSASQNFEHVCNGTSAQTWRSCSVEFIANSAITTLSLRSSVGGAANGPLVDGVRVEDISISCPGDVDGDGSVDGGDISLVLLNFGNCPQ